MYFHSIVDAGLLADTMQSIIFDYDANNVKKIIIVSMHSLQVSIPPSYIPCRTTTNVPFIIFLAQMLLKIDT